MRVFNYKLRIDNEWLDASRLVNSADTEIQNALCTTSFKSVTNTCSFSLRPSNSLFYAQVMEKLLQAQKARTDIDVEISDLNGKIVFSGLLDNSSLEISSARIPDSISIEGRDYIASLLDKKVKMNQVLENKSVVYIVTALLESAGYSGSLSAPDSLASSIIKYFVTTDDDDSTYREIIDTLLFELPGYVLYRNPATASFEIKKIIPDDEPVRTVNYRISDKLQTKAEIYDHDGIKVSYPTVETAIARPVYIADVDVSSPAEIPSGQYYPEDGDVQATYQEYDKNILDRAYNLKETRRQNSDLDILYVKNAKINITPGDVWDFPVVTGLDMPSNPVWFPRKAWILLRNKTSETQNLELMSIEGDTVYRSKINKITLPASASDPEEYETSYIFDEEHASEFSKWLYGMKTIGATITTWTEVQLLSNLGEKVIVSHKDSSVSQAHVVIQIKDTSLSGGIRAYKITAVAVSAFNEYEYTKDVTINSPVGKGIFREYDEYYNSDSNTELVGGTWSDVLEINPDKTLWTRRVVKYTDGSIFTSTATPSGSKGADGKDGKDGEPGQDGSYLSFDISRTSIDYYADDVPIDNSEIVLTASSDMPVTLSIDGRVVTTESKTEVGYKATPTYLFAAKDSVLASAATARMRQSYTISKNTLKGILSLTADKSVILFYADMVPHRADDKITLSIDSENYKAYPKLYINGTLQETEESYSYTFEVPYTKFETADTVTAKVVCGSDASVLVLSRSVDKGSISITCDKSVFSFYADNVPENASDVATLSITQTGYSTMPELYVGGLKKDYTAGTYLIRPTDLTDKTELTAVIKTSLEERSISITKQFMQADISLTLSSGVADYYYDNVAISSDITASVTYSGLYYAPLLKAGSTAIALTDGQGTIPISLFDDVDSGLEVTAYAQKFISYSVSQTVIKQTRPLSLSLGITGGQFSYDNDSNVSPSLITVTNNTEGLSDKGLVSLMVGGEIKSWTDNAFIVTPAMVTGRYIAITIGYGGETTTAIITKTYDGKAEIIEYSKTRSFTIYPDDEYGFEYNAQGVVYNGETMAWTVPWSAEIPDISSNEYLWRRSRVSDADQWQYTRLTGVKGDDGENAGGVYLGHFTASPTAREDGSAIEDGDYYLDVSVAGEPKPYRYKDGVWLLVTAEDSDWTVIASATMQDVNNYGGALLSSSAYYAFFQLLSAQKAFIASLGAQEITISNGGAIQSENYESSEGSEGFRIGADGNADFFNGTWRGAFANGLSFIPPTKMHITRQMKHKDVYRMMKKLGVSEGVYNAGNVWGDSDGDGCVMVGQAYTEQPPAFCCMDYDEEKMNAFIPAPIGYMSKEVRFGSSDASTYRMAYSWFGAMYNMWAVSSDAYLLLLMAEDGTDTPVVSYDGFYLLTKAKLESFMATEKVSSGGIDNAANKAKYLVKQTAFKDDLYIRADGAAIFAYYDPDTSTFHMLTDNVDTHKVHHYHFTAGDTAVTYDGDIVTGYAVNQISQSIFPAGYIHKIGGKYQMRIMAGAGSASAINRIFESEDMTNWTYVQMLDLSSYKPADATYMFIADAVMVSGRCFMIVVRGYSSEQDIGFYELTSNSLVNIPAGLVISGEELSSYGTNLFAKGGIVYSSLGKTMFKYDTSIDTYTDMTRDIMKSLRITIDSYTGTPSSPDLLRFDMNAMISSVLEYTESGYTKTVPMQDIFSISSLSWDVKEEAILITITTKQYAYLIAPVYYYPEDGSYKLFSVITDTATDVISNRYTSFNLLSNTSSSVYSYGGYMFFRGVGFSKQALALPNPAMDRMNYQSMVSSYLPLIPEYYYQPLFSNLNLIWSLADNLQNGIKDQWMISHAILHPDKPVIQIDSSSLKVNSVYPIYDCRKIAVREYSDRIEIALLEDGSYVAKANSMAGDDSNLTGHGAFANATMFREKADIGVISVSITAENLVPFLTIYKGSEEYMPAEIFWNFPAQLTAREDILKVNTSIVQMPIANAKNINS